MPRGPEILRRFVLRKWDGGRYPGAQESSVALEKEVRATRVYRVHAIKFMVSVFIMFYPYLQKRNCGGHLS